MPAKRRIGIGVGRLSPTAAGLLVGKQPIGAGRDGWIVHRHSDRDQPGDHLPGAVHVVDSPSAEPASIGFLRRSEVGRASADRRVFDAQPQSSQSFQHAAAEIGSARVDHRVVIGKWDAAEELPVVVAVEGAPAAVAVLHRQQPAQAAVDCSRRLVHCPQAAVGVFAAGGRVLVQPLGGTASLRRADQPQLGRQRPTGRRGSGELVLESHQHHRRVVAVGIVVVVVFKAPAARLRLDRFRPVAGPVDLPVEQPVDGTRGRRVRFSQAGCRKSPQGDGGVPDRRFAGLNPAALFVVNNQVAELPPALPHLGAVVAMTQGVKRQQAPDDRRVDRPHAVAPLRPFERPALRGLDGPLPQRQPVALPQELERRVNRPKETVPTERPPAGGLAGAAQLGPVLRRLDEQLANPAAGVDVLRRAQRRDDRERHDHRPRPGADRVQVHRKPFGEKHHLRRNLGTLFERNLPKDRQVESRVAVDGVGAAVGEDRAPRPLHVFRARVVARELEREIGLHAAADLDAAARVHRPAAAG